MAKLRVGWFTFTCSEDSSIVLIELMNKHYFEWMEKVDFRYCRPLKSKNVLDRLDVAFIEGAISSDREKERLLEIRSKTKYLVATGACACTGYPSAQRNDFPDAMKAQIEPFLKQWNLYRKVLRVDEVVRVDDKVDGCPMLEQRFIEVLNKYLMEFSARDFGAGNGGAGKGDAREKAAGRR